MSNVFVLRVNHVKFISDEYQEEYSVTSYPIYTWGEDVVGYYSSLEKAENAIHEYIGLKFNEIYKQKIYSFSIIEYSVNDVVFKQGFAPFETRRSYLGNGKLEETSLVSNRGFEFKNGKFRGRKPEEIRFKIGDIVEIPHADLFHGKGIVPCIVVGLPNTVEDYQKRSSYGDWSDDYYMLIPYLNREGEIVKVEDILCPMCSAYPLYPVDPIHVFPPSIPVTDEIKEALQTLQHTFNTERMERFKKGEEEGWDNFQCQCRQTQ